MLHSSVASAITSNVTAIDRIISPGDVFRHYKGSLYCVDMIAKHTEDEKDLVIYHATENPGQKWARPVTMFNEYVIIDGVDKLRFESVI